MSFLAFAGRVAGDRRVLLVNSLYHLTNDGAVQVLSGQIAILTSVSVAAAQSRLVRGRKELQERLEADETSRGVGR